MASKFKQDAQVVHPKHGLGCVGAVKEEDICGQKARYLTIEFARAMLTVRIPEAKVADSGLRELSSATAMQSALNVLPEARVAPAGHWSKRQLGLQEKLNSGEPIQLAEVVRDLGRGGHTASGGRLYREALLRLAEELALVEGVSIDSAQEKIEGLLAPDNRRKSA